MTPERGMAPAARAPDDQGVGDTAYLPCDEAGDGEHGRVEADGSITVIRYCPECGDETDVCVCDLTGDQART